jgi:hypothetical protein
LDDSFVRDDAVVVVGVTALRSFFRRRRTRNITMAMITNNATMPPTMPPINGMSIEVGRGMSTVLLPTPMVLVVALVVDDDVDESIVSVVVVVVIVVVVVVVIVAVFDVVFVIDVVVAAGVSTVAH